VSRTGDEDIPGGPLSSVVSALSFLAAFSRRDADSLESSAEKYAFFGQAGAIVGASNNSRISSTDVPMASAVPDRFPSVTEKPGALSDVSNVPTYILHGLIFHSDSAQRYSQQMVTIGNQRESYLTLS
jgi:hypothetical protein